MSEITEQDSLVVDADIGIKRQQLDAAFEEQRDSLLKGIKAHLRSQGFAQDYTTLTELAEEILQDTAKIAYGVIDRYDPALRPRPWLLKIALNHIRNSRRSRKRDELHIVPVAETPQARAALHNAEEPLSDDELFDLLTPIASLEVEAHLTVDEMLALVREDDRRVLHMKFVDNLSGRELAAELGISEGAVYTRVSRALTRLQTAYTRYMARRQED